MERYKEGLQDIRIRLLIANTIDYCVPDTKGGAFAARVYNLVKCNEIKNRDQTI